jgi:hypothetical protein
MGPDEITALTAPLWKRSQDSKLPQHKTDVKILRKNLAFFYKEYKEQEEGWSMVSQNGEEYPIGQSVQQATKIQTAADNALAAISAFEHQPQFSDQTSVNVLKMLRHNIEAA